MARDEECHLPDLVADVCHADIEGVTVRQEADRMPQPCRERERGLAETGRCLDQQSAPCRIVEKVRLQLFKSGAGRRRAERHGSTCRFGQVLGWGCPDPCSVAEVETGDRSRHLCDALFDISRGMVRTIGASGSLRDPMEQLIGIEAGAHSSPGSAYHRTIEASAVCVIANSSEIIV
jgi:hypothetical protein